MASLDFQPSLSFLILGWWRGINYNFTDICSIKNILLKAYFLYISQIAAYFVLYPIWSNWEQK